MSTGWRPVLGLALAAGMAAVGTVCRAQQAQPAEWRAVVEKHFIYAPSPAKPAAPAANPSFPLLVAQSDPDVVQMAPLQIRSKPIYADLRQDFALQEAAAKQAEINRNLGIGYKAVKVGPVYVGFVTVFHLPVMFLGGMSW